MSGWRLASGWVPGATGRHRRGRLARRPLAETFGRARVVRFGRVALWILAGLPVAERLHAAAGFVPRRRSPASHGAGRRRGAA